MGRFLKISRVSPISSDSRRPKKKFSFSDYDDDEDKIKVMEKSDCGHICFTFRNKRVGVVDHCLVGSSVVEVVEM